MHLCNAMCYMECIHYIGGTFNNFGDMFILQKIKLLWQIAKKYKGNLDHEKNIKNWITSLV